MLYIWTVTDFLILSAFTFSVLFLFTILSYNLEFSFLNLLIYCVLDLSTHKCPHPRHVTKWEEKYMSWKHGTAIKYLICLNWIRGYASIDTVKCINLLSYLMLWFNWVHSWLLFEGPVLAGIQILSPWGIQDPRCCCWCGHLH